MAHTWIDLIGASLGGGFVVKLFDYIYQEYRRRADEQKSVKNIIDRHIDPILKSSDELVGKIRSLAQSDFIELKKAKKPLENEFEEWAPYLDIIYLFAQFWSWVQILRLEALFDDIGVDERGKRLLVFFRTLEAKKVRLVERSWQRAIGETIIQPIGSKLKILTYPEFVENFLTKSEFRRWYYPLTEILINLPRSKERQRFLIYGTIIHALIDTLDSEHRITRDRPGWANKFSKKSKRSLKYRIFRIYLPFVENSMDYVSTEKR